MRNKKGAIELSIGTIVVIVMGVTMLILGMVLIRNIMCGALSLTSGINDKVKAELERTFGSTEGEIACIGEGAEAVKIIPGKDILIHCQIKAPETAQYEITLKDYSSSITSLTKEKLQKYITYSKWSGQVAPGDTAIKKVIGLKLPNDAPEGNIRLSVEIKKNGELLASRDLDFSISRAGFVRSAIC